MWSPSLFQYTWTLTWTHEPTLPTACHNYLPRIGILQRRWVGFWRSWPKYPIQVRTMNLRHWERPIQGCLLKVCIKHASTVYHCTCLILTYLNPLRSSSSEPRAFTPIIHWVLKAKLDVGCSMIRYTPRFARIKTRSIAAWEGSRGFEHLSTSYFDILIIHHTRSTEWHCMSWNQNST